MGETNWTVYPGPKINHITINRRGPLCVGESAVGQNGGPVCGDGNLGEYSTLGGAGRHGQLVTGRTDFNGSARSYSINTPQSTSVRLGGG